MSFGASTGALSGASSQQSHKSSVSFSPHRLYSRNALSNSFLLKDVANVLLLQQHELHKVFAMDESYVSFQVFSVLSKLAVTKWKCTETFSCAAESGAKKIILTLESETPWKIHMSVRDFVAQNTPGICLSSYYIPCVEYTSDINMKSVDNRIHIVLNVSTYETAVGILKTAMENHCFSNGLEISFVGFSSMKLEPSQVPTKEKLPCITAIEANEFDGYMYIYNSEGIFYRKCKLNPRQASNQKHLIRYFADSEYFDCLQEVVNATELLTVNPVIVVTDSVVSIDIANAVSATIVNEIIIEEHHDHNSVQNDGYETDEVDLNTDEFISSFNDAWLAHAVDNVAAVILNSDNINDPFGSMDQALASNVTHTATEAIILPDISIQTATVTSASSVTTSIESLSPRKLLSNVSVGSSSADYPSASFLALKQLRQSNANTTMENCKEAEKDVHTKKRLAEQSVHSFVETVEGRRKNKYQRNKELSVEPLVGPTDDYLKSLYKRLTTKNTRVQPNNDQEELQQEITDEWIAAVKITNWWIEFSDFKKTIESIVVHNQSVYNFTEQQWNQIESYDV